MEYLELRMNYSSFIKLRNFVKINDISAEIKEFNKKNDVVHGKLDVTGSYLVEDLVNTSTFNEEVPFSIIFSNNDFEIVDIDCINLEYQTVDGRGIEVYFDVLVKYEDYANEKTNEDVVEIPVVINDEPKKLEEFEEIKQNEEDRIDKIIIEQLQICDDNMPTEETIIDEENIETTQNDVTLQNEKRRKIKICYYKDSSELDKVCSDQNVGIDKIFNDNKNTDFVKYRRVIIK